MIIREERYGRPAASRLLFPTLRGVKFRTNSGNFHFPVLFTRKFKAAFLRGLRLYAKYATNFSTNYIAVSPTRRSFFVLFLLMAQDSRERERERKRFVRYEWNGWLKCFQSSNNREWEEILVSYRKWHSLSSLKSSFRRVSEGAWHQPSVHNRWNRCVAN